MANEFKIKKGLIVTGASGGTVVDIQGSQGQLFSVTDDLSGSIFAVSDISGVPILDVNSSGVSYFDGSLGIGTDSPNSKLHVLDGVAGTYTPYGESDTLVVESATPGGISLIGTGAGGDSKQSIVFGTTSDVTSASIIYNSNNSFLSIGTTTASNFVKFVSGNGVTALTLNASQNAVFEGTITAGIGTQAVNNDAILNIRAGSGAFAGIDIFSPRAAGNIGGLRFLSTSSDSVPEAQFLVEVDGEYNFYNGTNGAELRFTIQTDGESTFSGLVNGITPTANANFTTKQYVDGLITGATIYRGTWNAALADNSGYGTPDLSSVTKVSGYYYICSAVGAATPNGTGCEPDSWDVGDWVIWNDDVVDCAGTGTGAWQKIDNSSVISGAGDGQTVALWEGTAGVGGQETLGNAPITISSNDATFAGAGAFAGTLSAPFVTASNPNGAANGSPQEVARFVNVSSGATSAYMYIGASAGTDWRLGKNIMGTSSNSNFGIAKHSGSVLAMEIDGSNNTTFAGNVALTGDLKVTADAATADIVAQWADSNGNNTATFRTTTPGQIFEIRSQNSGTLKFDSTSSTFTGSVTASNFSSTGTSQFFDTVKIEKAQETNQFDTSSFLRLHPSAVTNASGYTNMFFGTSTANNFGVAIGAVRAGAGDTSSTNDPAFTVRILNDSVIGTEVLRINTAGNSTFAGDVSVTGANLNFLASDAAQIKAKESMIFTIDSDNNQTSRVFQFKEGSGNTLMIIEEAGNVGIGVTGPFSKLQVGSNTFTGANGMYANSRVGISNHGTLTGMMLASTYNDAAHPEYGLVFVQGPSTSSYNVWSISPDGPAKGDSLSFVYGAEATNIHSTTPKVVFDGNGNVGIGPTSKTWVPGQKLHINDGSTVTTTDANNMLLLTRDNHAYIMFSCPDGKDSGLHFHNTTDNSFVGRIAYDHNVSGDNMLFTVDSSEAMRIEASGNVGIGTTVPQTKLAIGSTQGSGIDFLYDATNNYKHQIKNYWNSNTDSRMDFNIGRTSGVTPVTIMSVGYGGNVGIGTTTPLAKLDIQGTQGQLFSVTDNLSGSIFAVSDISGVPIFDVNSSGVSTFDGDVDIKTSFGGSNFYQLGVGTTSSGSIFTEGKIFCGGTSFTDGEAIFNDNVGIGVTNPTNELHVHTATDNDYAIRIEGSTNNVAGVWTGLGIGGEANNTKSAILFEDAGLSYSRGKLLFCVNNAASQASATSGDAKLTISNDGNVGIRTKTPDQELEVQASVTPVIRITSTDTSIQIGESIGRLEMKSNDSSTGGNNVMGYMDCTATNAGSAYALRFGTGNGGAATTKMSILQNGYLGVLDDTPSYPLDVTGTIRATGDVIAFSDVRVKENIKTIKSSLDKVSKLRGVEFNKIGEDEKSIGVIAQEIEKVIPEVVKTDDEGMKSVAYGNISGLLIEAIKELKAEIDLLKSKPCNCNNCNCNI